jgi:hypothetical protein
MIDFEKELFEMARTIKDYEAEIDELQSTIDQAREILEDAYVPEAGRTDLVAAVGEALDLLTGEEEEDELDEDEDEEDDQD